MQQWETLAGCPPRMLLGTLILTAVLAIAAIFAIFWDKIDGYEFGVIAFVLALLAIPLDTVRSGP